MTLYITSKTRHAARWRDLRTRGIPIISTWIDEAGPGESPDLIDLARRCLDEAASADVTILYSEPGEILKGALIEVGAALAAGKRVIATGQPRNWGCFGELPLWTEVPTIEHALDLALPDADPGLPAEPPSPDFAAELETYRARLPLWLRSGEAGRFVSIRGREVAGIGETYEEALQAGLERFGPMPMLVRRIEEADTPLFFTRDLGGCGG